MYSTFAWDAAPHISIPNVQVSSGLGPQHPQESIEDYTRRYDRCQHAATQSHTAWNSTIPSPPPTALIGSNTIQPPLTTMDVPRNDSVRGTRPPHGTAPGQARGGHTYPFNHARNFLDNLPEEIEGRDENNYRTNQSHRVDYLANVETVNTNHPNSQRCTGMTLYQTLCL